MGSVSRRITLHPGVAFDHIQEDPRALESCQGRGYTRSFLHTYESTTSCGSCKWFSDMAGYGKIDYDADRQRGQRVGGIRFQKRLRMKRFFE